MADLERSDAAQFDPPSLINRTLAERFFSALTSFSIPDEKSLQRASKSFSKCPDDEIEQYFEFVASFGKPCFKWNIIRPAFLWKLEQVMLEMRKVEFENLEENAKVALIAADEQLKNQREFIMRKAREFEGTPFTIQRLCELLTTPSRHYKQTDKFLRAIEKNINVVTCITETGERITGVEDFPLDDDDCYQRIEQPFFVKVDEMDIDNSVVTPLSEENEYVSEREKAVENNKTDDDMSPINLSGAKSARLDLQADELKEEDVDMEIPEGDTDT